ncbi:protein SWOLLEN 1 isoform X5 [Apium graveolens]|uniref:protein SWOLLEN 1 isoform X5 n=1 Tax=Apium graveolens TaxID=4045 RepID=UPI003D7AEF65
MDYDNNDFEGHSHKLSGEESSKLSSVLHPYALPKFDFDDNLQTHLRFDTLVENEVYLGISNREDNQWIEDFSRVGSGIEFDSSATESCSVSRHYNVWFEATSSESVEMLLKSIGQEEGAPGEAAIEDLDAGSELGTLTKEMDPILKQDDKVVDNTLPQPALLPYNVKDSLEDSALAEHPSVVCTSEPRRDDSPSVGCSGEVASNVDVVMANEENLEADLKFDDAKRMIAECSINISPTETMKELSSASAVPIQMINIENANPLSHNITVNSGELDNQVITVLAESSDALAVDNSRGTIDHNAQSKDSNRGDEILSGTVDKTEFHGSSCEDSPVVCHSDNNPNQYVVEVSNTKAVISACPKLEVGSVEKDVGKQVTSLEDQNIDTHNSEIETSSCMNMKMDSAAENDSSFDSSRQTGTDVLTEAPVSVDHESGNDQHAGSDKVFVAKLSSLKIACTSAEREQPCNENIEGFKSPLTLDKSVNPREKDIASEEDVVYNDKQVVSVTERPNDELHSEFINKDCKSIGLSHSNECSEGDVKKPLGSEFREAKEQAKLLFAAKEVTSNVHTAPEVGVMSVGADKNYTAEVVTCIQPVNEDGKAKEVTSNVHTAPEVGVMSVGADKNYAAEVVTCIQPVNKDGKGRRSDKAAAEDGTECSEKRNMCSVSLDSAVTPLEGTAATEFVKGDEIPMEKNANVTLKEVSETMSPLVEPCLDQRQKDREAAAAFEKQIGTDTKDDRLASVALACPSIHCSDSMIEDGGGTVHPGGENCGHPLKMKETPGDHFQGTEASGADGRNKSATLHRGNEATGGLSSFTFDICPSNSPSEGKTSKGCQLFPSIQVDESMQVTKESQLASNSAQVDLKTLNEVSCKTPQTPVEGKALVSVKGTPDRKTRRASGKASVRSAKKGSNVKESTPGRQSNKEDKSPAHVHGPRTGQPVQFKELKPCGDVAKSGGKPLAFIPIPTSNLPDLNTSVPKAAVFQQPFTDLQQVQLRAQIFVYGSLIQESAPDEACMISAFGPSGGGDIWGPAWRACVERAQSRKSSASNMGTPIQSGGKASGQPFKHSLQSKALPSPAGRASSKVISSPAVTPIIPLSSPLWNVTTPCDGLQSSGMPRGGPVDSHQPLSSSHSYQVPGTRNFVGHNTSWPLQSPFSSSWMASPQNSVSDANVRFSVFPNTEPVKLTPARYSSVPSFPAMKIASVPVPHDISAAILSSQPDMSNVAEIPQSSVSKPRKRKNGPATEGLGNIPLLGLNQGASAWHPSGSYQFSPVPEIVGQKLSLPQSRSESVQMAAASTLFSTSVAVTAPDRLNFAGSSGNILGDQPSRVDKNEEKSCIPVQTINTVEKAKLHAESAAAHAANAVSHYHDIWNELAKQKNLGVISDVEAKLASSAVAITAATSVARAAAAAAMIASNVAAQAKLMADEVSSPSVIMDPTHSNSSIKATSSSILKTGEGSVYPSSIIAVAREAAKKRVEAASAASKHAENLDAIVKAAELAAEAVSQAGKILSVSGPLPPSELKDLVPASSEQVANKHIVNCDQPKAFSIELFNFSAEESKGGSSVVEAKKTGKLPGMEKEPLKARRGCRQSDLTKTTGVVPEADAGSRSISVADDSCANTAELSVENVMEEGCLVEVFKDGGNFKAAWYSANILSLKDEKAFLCYTDLQTEDGTGQLKEWVPLQGDCISMPKIRIAHPTTTMRFFDGTRRKRKAAVMDYSWSVGDRVDAWMQDCWREGVVKEKTKNDDTTLTINFPALGDTSVVKVWHLRPTLTWKDGKWTEWSSPRQHSPSQFQVNGPQEKRARLGSLTEAKGKEKISRGIDLPESRIHEDSRILALTENEKQFNVGKNTMHENKQDSRRTARTGLQKEGSRVVFGVPKPGKKRKFMDVSKHFDSDKSSKNMKTGDSVKFARNVAPQVSGSRGWTTSTKVDFKEKQAAEVKPKVLRSGKPPSASTRTLPRKDNLLTSSRFTSRGATVTDRTSDDAISNEDNDMVEENLMEFGSVSDSQDTSEGQTLASSLGLSRVPTKKDTSLNSRSERRNKGKNVPSAGRMSKKVERQEKLVPEVSEPRRSNRKIQPTSRLLEGLQSSLTIPKMPFSHDKAHRSQSRSKS